MMLLNGLRHAPAQTGFGGRLLGNRPQFFEIQVEPRHRADRSRLHDP